MLEQLSRSLQRRCSITKASNEVVELLSEHWAIFAPGCQLIPFFLVECTDHFLWSSDSTSTAFQPFFLDFYRVHSLATRFFLRMWTESGAATEDFTRVSALVRSQYVLHLVLSPISLMTIHRVKVALRSENVRPWYEVEQTFNEQEYREVRDRQMKELELEDDILSKVPVR